MNNILGVDLKLDQEYLAKAVQDLVKTSMAEALDSKESIIQGAIIEIINTKVTASDGKVDTYGYRDSVPLIEYTLRQAIVEMTKKTINEEVESKKEIIAEMVKKELSKKATLNKFVESFINNTAKTLENSWKTKINIDFEKIDD